MTKLRFVDAVQTRVARVACSASATRGQGDGVVEAGREFFAQLPLECFAVRNRSIFEQHLDIATGYLCNYFPRRSRSWGLARKLMNIFLRDVLYTSYLVDKYNLNIAEEYLEIPLDSITATRICEYYDVPTWIGVSSLTQDISEQYQLCAQDLAEEYKIARVHLDTYWWGNREHVDN